MAAGSQSSSARGPTAASSHGSPPPSGLAAKKSILHSDGKSFNLSENSYSSASNGVANTIDRNTDHEKSEENGQDKPELDIVINNVVCSFNVRCHLNLRDIALRGLNVEYRKENGVSFHKPKYDVAIISVISYAFQNYLLEYWLNVLSYRW